MKPLARFVVAGAVAVLVAIVACGSTTKNPSAFGTDGGGSPLDGGAEVDGASFGSSSGIVFNVDSAASCVGLACQQVACGGGAHTSISGTVYAPNGTLPLYNVIVYVPNAPLAPIDAGITCDQCGTIASGSPLVTALSDATGKFVLDDVPAGVDFPLVVQLGKWRRETTVKAVTSCVNTPLTDPNLTRLPKNQTEGNMPHIALTTGQCDSMGCMLGKLGIDVSEFGVQSDGPSKAINVYSSVGDLSFSDGFSNTTQASTLWTNLPLLETYDMGIFSCECSEAATTKGTAGSPAFAAVTDYVNAGGRIFTTDFQYTWYKYSADPNLAAAASIAGGAPPGSNPLTLNEGFPRGLALAEWLTAVFPATPLVTADGGPLSGGSISADSIWDNTQTINTDGGTQLWATADTAPHVFTLNTPYGKPVAQQCGKGVHLDVHITESSQGSPDFVGCDGTGGTTVGSAGCYPNTCTNPLKQDEAMFAFFFFDLASCVQDQGAPPTPPPPTPQ
jgi:hypothetical protein